jgi:hypothetical protein
MRRDKFNPELYDRDRARVLFHVRGNSVQGKSVVPDLSPSKRAVSAASVSIDRDRPWNGDYFEFDGLGVGLSATLSGADRIGNADFKMRVVFRTSASTAGVPILMGVANGGANSPSNNQILLYLFGSSLYMTAYQGAAAALSLNLGVTPNDGAWHVADLWRNGSTFGLMFDDSPGAYTTGSLAGALHDMGNLYVGSRGPDLRYTGDIHEAVLTINPRVFPSPGIPQFGGGIFNRFDWPER